MATNICAKLRAGVTTSSAEESRAWAAALAAELPPDATLALHGDLGTGKTTFVQGLARGFGIDHPVTSPTFAIYTLYRGRRTLVHLDAYRLETAREIDDLLLEDFLVSPYCLAIEWPEKIAPWVSDQALHLDLGITRDERHTLRLRDAAPPQDPNKAT
ncbi:MAG: tRNA (adenosine(37)-N6)-threonylcarbamoyltransferase complex ATPase subunit type 1 TsaE [Opitutales bacterium]